MMGVVVLVIVLVMIGFEKGICWLFEINMIMVVVLLGFILIVGFMVFLL